MKAISDLLGTRAFKLFLRILQSYAAAASVLFIIDADEPQFLSMLVFIMMFWLLGAESSGERPSRRIRIVAAIFAVFYAVACVFAKYAFLSKQYGFISGFTGYMLLCCWMFFFALLRLLYVRLSRVKMLRINQAQSRFSARQVFWISFALLAAVYTFVFLCYYPGIVQADTRTQLCQIVGLDAYSNHHPLAHTMLMKVFFDLGYGLFHTQNAGVAFACIAQYVGMAAVFAFLISTLQKLRVRTGMLIAAILFFGIVPVNMGFSITLVKDIPFAGSVLLMLTLLVRLSIGLRQGDSIRMHVWEWIGLFVASIGTCVLRTNGIYAFVPLIPLGFVFYGKCQWKLIPVLGMALVLSFLYRGPVLNALGITPPDAAEGLCIPAQQIARVIVDGGELSQTDEELLRHVVDLDQVVQTYQPNYADFIKGLIRETGDQAYLTEHAGDYFKLWLKLGLRYPKEYLFAEIDQTIGFWYPNISFTALYLGGIHPESTRLDISTAPVITGEPAALINAWFTGAPIYPIFGLSYAVGIGTWIAMAMFGMAIVNRRRASLIPYLFLLLLLGTLMVATPVHAEFRYLYAMFVSVPLLVVLPFLENCDAIAGHIKSIGRSHK